MPSIVIGEFYSFDLCAVMSIVVVIILIKNRKRREKSTHQSG
jgi:hypothetical protein